MARAKRGQIKKANIERLVKCLAKYTETRKSDIAKLEPSCKKYIEWLISDIKNQDYFFAVNSRCQHLRRTIDRCLSGEIVSIEFNKQDGSASYKLNNN